MLFFSAVAQTKNAVEEVSDIPVVVKGDRFIKMPVVPKGYHLVLKGSDHDPVINNSGRIKMPLSEAKVHLYFQLINDDTDTIHYDVCKAVTVPGKFDDAKGNAKPFVIPALQEWHGYKGKFVLSPGSRIIINGSEKGNLGKLVTLLQQEIKEQTGYLLKTATGAPGKGDIFLSLDEKDTTIGKEGYYFQVGDYISIQAIAYRGLFWGTRTLLQLLEQVKSIPKGIARDYPQFKIRGFVLDDGRKFFTLRFLRKYVKLLSYYKMNDFQIHLSDNGSKKYFGDNWDSTYSAFRLENDTYPGLTAKDGSYTKKEFIDLQQLADEYGVQIVPEIDVPAHSLAFSKAIPAIGSKKYGMDHLDLNDPLTDTVVRNVFKEYLSGPHPVFTGEVVDIGTDEYAKPATEEFRAFTDMLIKYVESFGKRVRLWGALTWAKGKTPVTVKGVTMNLWYNGYANPVDMKELGYKLISTPDGWLYIVPAAGYYYDYLNLKMIYDKWSPSLVGNVAFCAGDPSIMGGSFAEWNDIVGNGISEKDVNDRVFPAIQVLAQKMWGGTNTSMSYKDFAIQCKHIGEGPGLNIRGKIGNPDHPLVADFHFNKKGKNVKLKNASYAKGIKGKALSFLGESSYAVFPYKEIGYNYTVSFWINPASGNPDNTVLFQSPNAVVKLNQGATRKLGFSRDGYNFKFNYTLPDNVWTHIVISGTNKGTALFVNGHVQDSLYHHWVHFSKKNKRRKVETLFFPLEKVGGFKGKIDELEIWNIALSMEAIKDMKE
jgi:hexosaminidase